MANEKSYNRLFTGKASTATFLTIYTLHLLKSGDRLCGKDICNVIMERFRNSWSPSHGMIYPILRTMESTGLVEGKWVDRDKKTKRLYWITEKGKEALEEELAKNAHLFMEALTIMRIFMQDLYVDNKKQEGAS